MTNRGGRPPKPIEQKRRTGNPGKRKLPSGESLAAVPALDRDARGWELPADEVLAQVMDDGVPWLAATDMIAVCLVREALEDLEGLRGDPRSKPSDVAAYMKEITNLLSVLGFTPTARARLGLAEVKTQSKLTELLDRRRG